jgi:PAS domain S-box-containing protein
MLGATADITEQHESVLKLELLTERLRRAQEAAKVATWEWDMVTGHIEWSDNAQQVFGGSTRSESIEEFFAKIHPDDLESIRDSVIAAKTRPMDLQYRVRNEDGSMRWLLTRASPVDEHLIVGATLDVTQGKQAELALINSEKLAATGRLAATVAHEINNPLEAVMNLIYLLKTHEGVPEDARELAERADQELLRVAHMTRQTLAFYKGGGAARRLDLSQIAGQVQSLYVGEAKKKNVRIEREVEAVCVKAVDAEMRQVLSNLLSNAIAAAPQGGRVRVSCGETSEKVRLVLEDSGSGVSEELREKIFEPFFTTKQDFGTGLGLWVTRELVTRMGGTIEVGRSERLGGAAFLVELPAVHG